MHSFLVVPDIHLGKSQNLGKSSIGNGLNSRVVDQVNLLEWILEKAINTNITDLILTGDVFEEPKPASSLVSILISWLKKCHLHSINVHIVVGNHDVLRSGTAYSSPLDIVESCDIDGVIVYRNINTLVLDGFAITFVPFRDRKSFLLNSNSDAIDYLKTQLTYELSLIPNTYKKIIVGHLAIEGSIYVGDEIDDISNELLCPLDIFYGYDYVWMGHVHKPQVINQSPHIAHIGSMDISDFGEVDHEKKIVIFNQDLPDFFEYHQIPTRKLNKISISVPEEVEDINQFIIQKIKESDYQLGNSITRVEVDLLGKEKNVNKTQIEKFLLSSGVFNVSSILESRKQATLKKDSNKINNKMDVASAIKQYAESYLEEEERSEYIQAAMDIWEEFREESK